MFSVTKTELKVFPLCTKNVWPTKSGVTIERRDQVLIGFFAPELFILSIFSRRYDSTKGPFFNDLAIKVKFVPKLSSRAPVEGSRCATFKIPKRDPSAVARDDKVISSFSPFSFPK